MFAKRHEEVIFNDGTCTVNGLTQKRFWFYRERENGDDVFVTFLSYPKRRIQSLEEGTSQ